jgi:hypothetical protein
MLIDCTAEHGEHGLGESRGDGCSCHETEYERFQRGGKGLQSVHKRESEMEWFQCDRCVRRGSMKIGGRRGAQPEETSLLRPVQFLM